MRWGLAVLVVAPRNPVKLVQRAAVPVFDELAAVLDDVASGARGARDLPAMERTLERARATDGLLANLRDALVHAEETVRLAPSQWSERGRIERYGQAAPQVELAMRNARVLARAGVRAVDLSPSIPAGLISAIRHLAAATRGLEPALSIERDAASVRATAILAAAEATHSLDDGMGFAINVLVGQVRATATDLLRALGVEDPVEQVRAAAGAPG